jgi:two-component system, response regulator PdtaR
LARPVQGEVLAKQDRVRVLIVEDQPILAMELATILEECGCEIAGTAATRAQAAAIGAMGGIDLAFVDLQLKDGWTGGDVGEELALIRRVPVIYLSANLEQAPAGLGAALGGIPKPYDPAVVANAIAFAQAVLRGDRGVRPPPAMQLADWLAGPSA